MIEEKPSQFSAFRPTGALSSSLTASNGVSRTKRSRKRARARYGGLVEVLLHLPTKFMKRVFVVLLASLLGFGTAGATDDAEIERALQNMSRTLNAQLPSGGDDFMVISVTAGPGKRFTYFGVSSTPAELWNVSLRSESFAIAVDTYCTIPGMAAFRDHGVTVAWNVSDKTGRHVYTNTVSPKECRR